MRSFRAFATAAAVGISSLGTAHAADMLPPLPQDMPLRGSIVEVGGFYVRGDAGVAINTLSKASSTIGGFTPTNLVYSQNNNLPAPIFGLGVGYQFNNWFRADLTGEYHGGGYWNSTETFDFAGCNNGSPTNGRCTDAYKGNFQHYVGLANGYFDLGTWGGMTPYIGAGIGGSYNMISSIVDTNISQQNPVPNASPSAKKFQFAYAGMAGFSVDVAQNLKLDVGYRYLNMGKSDSGTEICKNLDGTPCGVTETHHFNFASNDIRVGLRYTFGGGEAVAARPGYAQQQAYVQQPYPPRSYPAPSYPPLTSKY